MINRREFFQTAGVSGLLAALTPTVRAAETPGTEKMRFGVLSDIHIASAAQQPYFEKALRKLDEWKVDAVLACGDLADFALKMELELVAESWFKVFPGGKGSDGRPVANLMHYGDHDLQDARYVDCPEAEKAWPDKAFRHANIIRDLGPGKVWEDCFHEPWAPLVLKEVKGYKFVLSHFTRGEPGNPRGDNVPGLKEFLAAHHLGGGRPFFYSQHRIPRNTACGPTAWGQDDGTTTSILSDYPNAIAFCGHCHMNGVYEKSIWQGAFTCMQVPSLSYAVTQAGRENGYSLNDRPPVAPAEPVKMMRQHPTRQTHQGFLCRVCDRAVVISRWDFEYDLSLGPDWTIPLSSFAREPEARPFAFARRAETVPVPEFAPGSKVALSEMRAKDRMGVERDMLVVSFPSARAAEPRANDYEVSVEMQEGEVERIFLQKRVYSSRYLFGTSMDDKPVRCFFSKDEIPAGWPLRFSVRPVNAFGRKGAPISTPFAVYPVKRKK